MRLMVLVCLCGLVSNLWAQEPEQAETVIREQIQAFADGNADTAYAIASEGIQQQFDTPDRFIDMVRSQYPALYQPQFLTFSDPLVVSSERVHQELMVVDRSGRSWQAWYSLVSVDERWRIEGVFLRPAEQQAI